MQMQQDTTKLLNQTLQALSGTPTDVAIKDGTGLIDSWLGALDNNDSITGELSALKTALESTTPDGSRLSSLLMNLSKQTATAASSADEGSEPLLRDLAKSLSDFAQKV